MNIYEYALKLRKKLVNWEQLDHHFVCISNIYISSLFSMVLQLGLRFSSNKMLTCGLRQHASVFPSYSLIEIQVTAAITSLKLSQRFLNSTAGPIECTYKLPVDAEFAIVELTICTDDGRVMKAAVEDKEAAQEKYSDAISAGRTAVMGAENEQELLFSIGNLAPQTGVEVTVGFVTPVKSSGKKWRVEIPQWLVSTFPKAPITVPEFWGLPEEERNNTGGFSMTVQQFFPIKSIVSSTHPITTTFDADRLTASIALLEWSSFHTIEVEFDTDTISIPQIQTQYDQKLNEYVGMISVIPPLVGNDEEIEDTEGKGDFVILMDRSGSMEDGPIQMAKEAAVLFIKSLSVGNTFNVISFGRGFSKMFPTSQAISTESVASAVSQISSFSADMGGTDILSPLKAIYAEELKGSSPRSLYLVTDGAVEDREAVVQIIEQHSKQVVVNAFGIGGGVDRALITSAANAAKGSYEFITNLSNIKKNVVSVLKKALLPALSSIEVEWPDSSYEQYPSNRYLPVCYYGEVMHAFVHFGSNPPPGIQAKLRGIRTSTGLPIQWEVPIDINYSAGSSLHKLWAKYAVKELSIEYKAISSAQTLSKLKLISKSYGVPSSHTVFLCVLGGTDTGGKLQAVNVASVTAEEFPMDHFYRPPASYATPMIMEPFSFHEASSSDSEKFMDVGCALALDEGREECKAAAGALFDSPMTLVSQRAATKDSQLCAALSGLAVTHSAGPQLLQYGLLDIVTLQEVDGLWLSGKIEGLYCAVQDDWTASLWSTLCILVLLEVKFAREKEEWELVARKAKRALKTAGMEVSKYAARLEEELAKLGVVRH